MKTDLCIENDQAVHTLALHGNDTLTVVDTSNTLRMYALEDLSLVNGFKTQVEAALPYIHNIAISANGRYLLIYRNSTKELMLFAVEKKKFVLTFKPHNAGTESAAFTPDGRAFITGGVDGRTSMWSLKNGKRIDTFPHHADAVGVITLSPDARLVATAGFDHIIKVTNRSFRNNKYRLISHKAAPTTLTFLSEQRLLSTDKEGNLLIWDIHDAKVIRRLSKFPSHVTAVAVTPDEQFLFVCGMLGDIGLYDLKAGSQLAVTYLHALSAVTSAGYDAKRRRLICGLVNGNVVIYDFAKEAERYREALEQKAYAQCYEMLEADPMLAYDPVTDTLEALFENYYTAAKKLLMQEETAKATALLQPFTRSGAKRLHIQKLFKDFQIYRRFAESAKGGKYAMAYGLAEEYGTLKETPLYAAMEKQWQRLFEAAGKIPVDKSYEAKLRQLFKPYTGVPGKSIIINTLHTNGRTVQLFQKLVGNNDYAEAFQLVENYPFLKNLDDYRRLLELGDQMEQQMHDAFNAGKYPDAVNLAQCLEAFPSKSEHALTLRDRANTYATAMSYYAEKRFADVYNIIEKHPYLAEAEIGQNAERLFKNALLKAEIDAAAGNVEAIKTIMQPFMKIRSKVPSIIHLIQVAYLGQLERLQDADAKGFETALQHYLHLFGYDTMLDDELSQMGDLEEGVKENAPEARSYMGSPERLPDRL